MFTISSFVCDIHVAENKRKGEISAKTLYDAYELTNCSLIIFLLIEVLFADFHDELLMVMLDSRGIDYTCL